MRQIGLKTRRGRGILSKMKCRGSDLGSESNMKNLLLLLSIICASLCASGAEIPVKCVSHRGEEKDAPEASRPAFELAAQRRADIVKLDIRFTKDGVVVLSHDGSLKRTMNWDVPIADLTLAEIREKGVFLEVGGYRNEKLLTLREGLAIVRECPEFWVDTKAFTEEGFERALAEFDRLGIGHDRIMVATFNREALRYVQKKHPEIRRVLHIYVKKFPEGRIHSFPTEQDFKTRDELLSEMLKWRDEFGLYGFNLPRCGFGSDALTEAELRRLRAEGSWCSIWFVNDAKSAAAFNRMGADAFVTGEINVVRPCCARPLGGESGK